MNAEMPDYTIFDRIVDGGLLYLVVHVFLVGIAIYVILRAWAAYFGCTRLPLLRYVLFSFLPLVAASFGVYLCLAIMWDFSLLSPEIANAGALPWHIRSARLLLYSGWIGTTLSLLSVYAASRVDRT
jgi:hypothetical protein